MQPFIVNLLPGSKAAWNEKRVHRRAVGESVIGKYRETGLSLDRPVGIRHEESVQLRIEPAGDREDAVGSGEVDDLRILKDVDPKAKPGIRCGAIASSFVAS